jgi:hygromycin-B 7''-O-kinase
LKTGTCPFALADILTGIERRNIMSHVKDPQRDPVLSSEIVLEIAKRFCDAQSVTGVEESGGEARTYYIDEDKVLKVQRPHRTRDRTSQKREAFFFKELQPFPEIAMPEVLGYGKEEKNIEYTLMSRIPGQAMSIVDPTGEKRKKVLFDLGKMLYFMHNLPDQEKLLASDLFPVDQNKQALEVRLIAPLRKGAEKITKESREWSLSMAPADIVEKAFAQMEYKEKKALHSNPALSHTFVDPVSHELTGLIDLGDAYISHPSIDLKRFPCPADRQDLLKGYVSQGGVDDSFMSIWIVNQLIADFSCVVNRNEYEKAALDNIGEIVNKYLLN